MKVANVDRTVANAAKGGAPGVKTFTNADEELANVAKGGAPNEMPVANTDKGLPNVDRAVANADKELTNVDLLFTNTARRGAPGDKTVTSDVLSIPSGAGTGRWRIIDVKMRFGGEAVTGIIAWARTNNEIEYLKYPVDKRNIPSRKIPEANDGVIDHEFRQVKADGFELDEVEYRIYR